MKLSVAHLMVLSTAPAMAHLRALQGYPFDISPQEMGEFRSQRFVKGNTDLYLQKEAPDGSFIVEGNIVITKNSCKPIDAYAAGGATYSSGGTNQGSAPKPDLCSVTVGQRNVLVARNPASGKVDYAVSLDKSNGGKSSTIMPIKGDVLATIQDSDLDNNALKRFDLGDPPDIPEDNTRRRTSHQQEENEMIKTITITETETTGHRSLQTACGNGDKRQIRVAIAYDSSFCAALGGNSQAIDRINAIVIAANNFYDQTGLCKVVEIAHLDSGCDGSDYFSTAVDETDMCTADRTNDVLETFLQKWKSSSSLSSVQRSSAHLFFGQGQGGYRIPNASGGSTIGCAYIRALCNSFYGYGVNYMFWNGASTPVNVQSVLFTHELGHSAGSDHDPSGGFVMGPSLNGNVVEFSSNSKTQINDHTDSRSTSCVPVVTTNSCSANSDCDDGNDCTDDMCSGGVCTNTVTTGNSCSDGNSCTNDVCISGTCEGTFDATLPGCAECYTDTECDDNNSCTDDVCTAGICFNTVNTANSCSDGDSCTTDTCLSSGVCSGIFDFNLCPECSTDTAETDCNDFNSCTDDVCSGGQCFNTPDTNNSCTDNDSCTADSCTSDGSCSSTFDSTLPGCVPTCPVAGQNCKWAACCPGLTCRKNKGNRFCA